MSSTEPKPPEEEPEIPMQVEERDRSELVALGIGCLVVAIFFGSILLAGFLSGR